MHGRLAARFAGHAKNVDRSARLQILIIAEKAAGVRFAHRQAVGRHRGRKRKAGFLLQGADLFPASLLQIGAQIELDGHALIAFAAGDGKKVFPLRHTNLSFAKKF